MPTRVLRLTRYNYRRLASGVSSIFNQNTNSELSVRLERENPTEFDYRQNLHMECGVLALDPPPSYAASLEQQQQNVGGNRTSTAAKYRSEDVATKLSPPPYEDISHKRRRATVIHLNVISVSGGETPANIVSDSYV